MKLDNLEQLSYRLGIDRHQLSRLLNDHNSQSEQCYQLLLQWWQQQPINGTLEGLYKVLCNTGQGYHLLDVLRNDSSYNDLKILSKQSGISEEFLNSTVVSDTKLLQGVAFELKNWCNVGRTLDLKECELQQIQYDYQHSVERGYQMLNKWGQKNGSNAKLSQLVIGLVIMSQQDALNFIKFMKK